MEEYNKSIEHAKQTIAELDTSIAQKTEHMESLQSLASNIAGKTKVYKDTKLNIPLDMKSGRYKAEGTGTLMIYSISGTALSDKVTDLSLIDTHSYTFDIESGQSIVIKGTVSLTEITE